MASQTPQDITAHDGPTSSEMSDMDRYCLKEALAQAEEGMAAGGIPIGSVLYHHPTRRIISRGHNQRVQKGSMILHAEMDCYDKLGRPKKEDGGLRILRECTLYTTLSPCIMCSGTSVLYQIPRVVLGENKTFKGGEDLLRQSGAIVLNAEDAACEKLMSEWVARDAAPGGKGVWLEDIGEI